MIFILTQFKLKLFNFSIFIVYGLEVDKVHTLRTNGKVTRNWYGSKHLNKY